MNSARPTIRTVDPELPDRDAIDEAARVLRAGGLVAFPTETVYGLGANGLDGGAVAEIFTAKRRPAWNPVILHVNGIADAARLVDGELSETERRLLDTYWPGPLTLVVRGASCVPDVVTAGGPTVGLRAPDHPVAQALIRSAGFPVAAPSANRFMGVSPTSAEHVVRSLGDRVDFILDGGKSRVGIESTVCKVVAGTVTVLRSGGVTPDRMRADGFEVTNLSQPSVGDEPGRMGPDDVVASPGLHERHYAPDSKLTIVDGREDFVRLTLSRHAHDEGVGFIVTPSVRDSIAQMEIPASRLIVISSDSSDADFARDLYRALHDADASGFRETMLTVPADGPLNTAIRDRLRRASDYWLAE